MDIDLRFEPVTPERWADFETLFGPRGAFCDCWCVALRLPHAVRTKDAAGRAEGAHQKRASPPVRRRAFSPMRRAQPVAWVQVGPRHDVPQFNSPRTVSRPLEDGDALILPSGPSAASSCRAAARQGPQSPSAAGRDRPREAKRCALSRRLSHRPYEAVEIGDALHRLDRDLRCGRLRAGGAAKGRTAAHAAGFAAVRLRAALASSKCRPISSRRFVPVGDAWNAIHGRRRETMDFGDPASGEAEGSLDMLAHRMKIAQPCRR